MNDQLVHYVDGELDVAGIAAVEAAIAADPSVANEVARYRALRLATASAFNDVLAEPVPAKLLAAVRSPIVTDIAEARERRDRRIGLIQRWSALAAMLVVGLLTGRTLAPAGTPPLTPDPLLSRSLDGQAVEAIAINLSYRDRAGTYCRVFRDDRAAPAAGIACRAADGWALRVVAAAPSKMAGAYRTASSDLPPAVLATLDATIAGAPLDAAGEANASGRAWKR